jgi:hypothetical protein
MTPTKAQLKYLQDDIDGLRDEAEYCTSKNPDSLACMYASVKMKCVADRLEILFNRLKQKEPK